MTRWYLFFGEEMLSIGSKPFSKCNEFLLKNNLKPIDWQIENI